MSRSASAAAGVGTVKTTRLRKLECDREGCGYIARVSLSAMRRGLPGCYCGGTLMPVELPDVWACEESGAMTAEQVAARPCVESYHRELHSVERGQERAAGHGRRLGVDPSTWRAPHDVALERVHAASRSEAAARRAAAGKRPVVAADAGPIPF